MMLKSLVVDDENIAGKGLAGYCNETSFIQLEKICTSAAEAKNELEENNIDLIFLDIQMPDQTGLTFLKSLIKPPMVIITTAFPNYALDGFELDVIDYIVKPFSFERFLKACNKAKEFFELKKQTQAIADENYFFIKADNRIEKIEMDEILFIKALENYISIHTEKRKFLTLISLKSIEQILPMQDFIKVHKSFIIAKNKIQSIQGNVICISNNNIPISKKWKNEVLNKIVSDKLIKR